jgi:Fur family transcriptional regulator, peroxide stress response regulator
MRDTKARRAIIEEIAKVYSHPTADEIYGMVRKRIPRVSLGTIYRNLEILSENGVILKLDLAGTQRRYDGTIKNHYHFRCLGCGQVTDLPVKPLDEVEELLPREMGYKIMWHRLEFHGLCPSCKSTQRDKAGEVDKIKVASVVSERKGKEKWI